MTDLRDVGDQFPLANLLNDFAGLRDLLLEAVKRGDALNAFLFSAGIHQIVEDDLFDPLALSKISRRAGRQGGPGSAAARSAITLTATAMRLAHRQHNALSKWAADLASVVNELAEAVASGDSPWKGRFESLPTRVRSLLDRSQVFDRAIATSVVRLPPCFRAFDQRPRDLALLADRFALEWPEREVPLAVIGVRTSGSYLGPLQAAFLRQRGYNVVATATVRPSQTSWRRERTLLEGIVRGGGLVLLTDDPPLTGGVLASVARDLERVGIPRRSIVLMLQLLGDDVSLPQALAGYASVLLPWSEWSIHENLRPAAIAKTFASPSESTSIEEIPIESASPRSHVRALFRIGSEDRLVYAKGVGLGYMGDHSIAVARALEQRIPHVFGVRDGVLYREWMPEERRITSLAVENRGEPTQWLAEYAARRNRALPVSRDTAAGLLLRGAVWHASKLIASAFGRGAVVARLWALVASRRLLRAERPSVVDGDLAPERWFVGENGSPVKVGFGVSTFDNSDSMELYCFDPAADIASAVATWGDDVDADMLLRAYHDQGGAPIAAARLALHELVYLSKKRGRSDDLAGRQRAMARAIQRYLSRVTLSEISPPRSGPVWAIDVDGVLETGELGFPASNVRACHALRALMAHGRRPVLATARSLDDARDRCRSYRTAGAIAEYGAVIYTSEGDTSRSLVSSAQADDLSALRSVAEGVPDVEVTPGYSVVVQAYRVDRGRMRALTRTTAEDLLARAGVRDRVSIRSTRSHTDFIPVGIDKGTAVRPLLDLLGESAEAESGRPLEVAIGDTSDDLPLFAHATAGVAPAGARELRGRRGLRFANSGQGALVDAVTRAIGHRPGACDLCRLPLLSTDDRILGLALDALGRGPSGKLRHALSFAFAVSRMPRRGVES